MASRIPTKGPTTRTIPLRALVYQLSGAEQPYDVYRFSRGKRRYERPRHNPFKSGG